MSTTLFRNTLAALLVLGATSPSMSQFNPYENLAFVPRQGQFNLSLTGIEPRLSKAKASGEGVSVNQIAEAYREVLATICAGNPKGEIVNWFAKIHNLVERGSNVQVEMIVAERASIIAMLPANSALVGQVEAAAGRWVRIDGSFIPDASCLLQVPPLTVASIMKPQYLATITAVLDTVTPAEVGQLENALPNEVWLPAVEE